MAKPTTTQLRVLHLIDTLTDREFMRLDQKDRPKLSVRALQRLGLIQLGVTRMGGGWHHGFWRITEQGHQVLSSSDAR